MNNRKVIINKVCKLNRETISSTNPPDFINYLDTGNITRNKINEVKKLINGIDKYPSRAQRKVQQNTIIYSTVRPEQEHFGIVENPIDNLIVSTGFTTIDVLDENINAKYLFYCLTQKNITEYLNTIAANNVTAYPSLNPSDIGNLILAIPDKLTQQKIANVLSSLDSKIEINNNINVELESMAKTLYDYWFVQFDFPDKYGKPYKSSGGKMVYIEALKREIPVGWEVGNLSSIAQIIGGSTPPREKLEYFSGNGTAWITPKDLSINLGNKFITKGLLDVTEKGIKNASLNIMPIGTVLLSSRAPIGYLAISREQVTTNQGFKSFVEKGDFSKEYIYYTVKNLIPSIENNAVGSTFKEVSAQTLKAIKIGLPDRKIIKNYTEIVEKIFKRQDNLEIQNQQLTELRDWLLPMLMNGQVTVSNGIAYGKDEVLALVAEPSALYEKTIKVVAKKVATKKPNKEKTPVIKLNPVDVYKRTLLAAEIVFQYKSEYTLGHLKLQKMLYLCKESENMNLPMNFLKQAMGPYDNQLARSLDKQFKEKKWFKYQNGDGLKYVPLENCGKHSEDFKKYFEDQLPTINKLIETFRKFKSQEIEAVATLYSCWKETIVNNELVNDAVIINKFYNWSKEKEKFKQPDLVTHLDWMRENGIYPKNLQAI
ncbi:restriction endonuclease subunit S [Flavobacterium psychrophilum]|uniref:restriction endonuclease subunit S n=1 Tax=Flavobacterium psychrophilum TaxID=96345 RepID=UPI000B7C37A1|nr:restriction endonuclease subunit S [Flavobacterium psychrophilum]MBF2024389.1 restriction endonuclease subunit S [Flavobacterium psychrophilum]MCB5984131.1 restriction endonuclease subunit S [Flavobacterium psychrophilum]MCB5994126.1 restriction endonuclease subunit S [Flavobacterium psychrophilum]MCB5997058.1 restriction endonuclease subunit S [Flavobacterium psychrophilum]MCB6004403.1 restriction endonuclease subunit S [Flavobacterium psychrophilum]